ncbi:MAG: hypothetical protein ACI9XU_001271 [Arenicella sp.]|jgi:hypothetical protein
MSGENNLQKLLSSMSPKLMVGEFVFVSIKGAVYGDHAHLEPVATVVESEGLTFVISRDKADQGSLSYESVFKCITLEVHSSLDAVGLTAAFSTRLGQCGISANVIAGYFHDHIFVQAKFADKAVAALIELSQQ